MKAQYKILFLEDSRDDALLIERELRKGGLEFVVCRAENKEEFIRLIRTFEPDIVLSDYWLKDFDGLSAIRLARVLEIDVPFVLITGSTNEEVAVECIKAGAVDYILKDRLARLVPAVRSALEIKHVRAQKDEAVEQLREGEVRFRQITEHMLDLVAELDLDLRYVYASPNHRVVCGYDPPQLNRQALLSLVHPEDRARVDVLARSSWLQNSPATTELRFQNADGSYRWFEVAGSPMTDIRGVQTAIVLAARDISERKRMEEETRRQQTYLAYLSDSAMAFVDFPTDGNVFRYVAERFREMLGNAIVVVNSFDAGPQAMQTEVVVGTDSILQRMLNVLGKDPAGMVSHPDEETKRQLMLGRLVQTEGGLRQFAVGHLPKLLAGALESMFDIRGSYSIGLVQKAQLLGSIVFIIRQKELPVSKTVLETFALQASIALQRRKAEQALKESEARLRMLVETSPDGIAVTDLDGRLVSMNAHNVALLGYTDPSELIGRQTLDLILPEDRARAAETIMKTMAEGYARDVEYRLVRRDGSMLWTETSTSLIPDAAGKPRYIMAVTRDITERKRAVELLRESEERFRDLTELLPQPVFETNEDGRVTLLNRSAFAAYGFSEDDMRMGITLPEMVVLSERSRAMQDLERVYNGQPSLGNEFLAQRRDGTTFPALIYSTAIKRRGRVIGVRGMIIDISERKVAETSVHTSEERYRLLVENASDAIVLTDLETGIILEANARTAELTGRRLEDIIGMHHAQLHPAEEIDRSRELSRLASERGAALSTDLHLQQIDGFRVPVDITMKVFTSNGRRVALENIRDVSERRQAEIARRDAERRLEEIVREAPYGTHLYELQENGELTFIGANRAADQILGIEHSHLLGQTIEQAFPRLMETEVPDIYRRIAREGGHYSNDQAANDEGSVHGSLEIHAFQTMQNRVAVFFRDIAERKRTAAALRESEEKFRTLVEQSTEGFVLIDEKGCVSEWNRAHEVISGIPRSEAVGKDFVAVMVRMFPPGQRTGSSIAQLEQAIAEALHTGTSPAVGSPMEMEILTPAGQRRQIILTLFPVQTMKGFRLGSITRDVTAEKLARQELKRKQDQLEQITSNLLGVVYRIVIHADGRWTLEYVSDGARELFGVDARRGGENLAHMLEAVHAEDRGRFETILRAAIESGRSFDEEYRMTLPSREVRWQRNMGRLHRLSTGEAVIDGFVVDVTERRQVQKALAESESKYRTLFNAISEAIFVHTITPEHRPGPFVEVNDAACERLGYSRDELLHMKPMDIDAPEGRERIPEAMAQLMAHGQARWEGVHRTKDGRDIPVEIVNHLFSFGDQQMALSTVRDISDRRMAENILRASERLTQYIVLHDPNGIAVFDREMRFITASDRFLEDNVSREEDIIGKYFYDVVPDMPEHWKGTHRRCLAGAVERTEEESFLRRDGSTGYHRWECRPWYDIQGAIGGTVVYIEDITKRKRVEEQLRKLSRAVEQSPSLIMIADAKGNLEYVNPKFCQVTGYSKEEVIGANPRFLKSGLTQPDDYRNMWETITSGREWCGEFLNRKKNKELFFVSASIIPIVDSAGVITHYLAVTEDITHRKRMEQRLKQSEERYRTFFEEDLAGAFMADAGGVLLACNPAFARIFGFGDPAEAQQHNLYALFPAPNFREDLVHRLRVHKKIEYERLTAQRKDGKSLSLLQSISGTFNTKGELTEIKGYVIDATEERLNEEQVRQSQKMESLGALAGGIAHDFNNILNNILGFAGQIKKYASDPTKVQRYGETIEKSALRGAELASHLLTATRQKKRELSPTNVRDVIEEVARRIREMIPPAITCDVRVDDALREIRGERGSLYQMLFNLCLNASEAMPHGGQLRIEASNRSVGTEISPKLLRTEAQHALEIRVSDTGVGIPAEIRDKIFEPFFTTKDKGRGSGLGLAIAYNVVRDHGGSILAESAKETGAAFSVYLPAIEEPQASVPAQPLAVSARGNNELILLVDDEEPMQELGKELLEELGYRVMVASDGLEAVELYREHGQEVSLVILDLIMPHMDGGQTYVELKKRNPNVKAIFCSGFTSEKVITDLLREEHLRAIQKPFHPADFIRVVQEVLAEK